MSQDYPDGMGNYLNSEFNSKENKMSNMLHMHTIMREFGIDAGHRLYQHEGKCKHLHGHRYTFQIYLASNDLDFLGRVCDFGTMKETIGKWLEDNWDHGMILNGNDPLSRYISGMEFDILFSKEQQKAFGNPFKGLKYYLLPVNPTAENLASFMLAKTQQILNEQVNKELDQIRCTKVGVWETPNCYAEASI